MENQSTALAFQAQPSDVLIAVMGITGCGKSTFISHCTDEDVPIGTSLHSHTHNIGVYPCKPSIGDNVYLVDTPGFDDTEREDADVLKEIAAWVTDTYEQKIHLRGILYLHRITDVRMQGAAMRNLFMFKKLCGQNAIKSVVLVTTMWEDVEAHVGERREDELRTTPDYWQDMIKNGSRIIRHQNNFQSAHIIINTLLENNADTTLAIQTEMVDEKKDLHDTSAGKELSGIIAQERERFARRIEDLEHQMAEAKEANDRESQEQIRLIKQEREAAIEKLLRQQESIKVSLEQLHQEKFAKLEQLLATQQSQMERDRLEIAELKRNLANFSITPDPEISHDTKTWTHYTHTYILRDLGEWGERSIEDTRAVFSQHASLLAFPYSDGRRYGIQIWDMGTGRCLKSCVDHEYECLPVMFISEDRQLASCSSSCSTSLTVKIWDVATGTCIKTHEVVLSDYLSGVAFSPDASRIALGFENGSAKIWDATTSTRLRELGDLHAPYQGLNLKAMVFSQGGRRILTSWHGHGGIKIWDVATGNLVQNLDGRNESVWKMIFSPDYRYLASIPIFGWVEIWDAPSYHFLRSFESIDSHIATNIFDVAFSSNSRQIVSVASNNGTVRISDCMTGACLQQFETQDSCKALFLSPDGCLIAAFVNDNRDAKDRHDKRYMINIHKAKSFRRNSHSHGHRQLPVAGAGNIV
ncbi:quinon protein alcohol dehydrogenase-like superfamily [Xylaria curta]|nr:quinon protein alcohol dehydrogenase-like superfamily [Xylaria curta]